MKRVIVIFLVFVITISACSNTISIDDPPEVNIQPVETALESREPETTSEPASGMTIPRPALSPEQREERIQALGLSVSEGYYHFEKDISTISARLDDYVSIGVKSVRIDANFDKPSEGVWILPEKTKHFLEAAAERGLLVKLIPQTIKDPPEWLLADENARFKDANGRYAISAVSYWYDGIKDFCETALRAQLEELRKHGLLV